MSEGLLNIIKGFAYEQYVKSLITDEHTQTWLWKECPVDYLIQSGIINSYNEHRLYRKSVKNNEEHTLIDTGIDIIKYKDNEFTMIQCKNYKNSIQISDLAGFWFMACNYPKHLYEVIYTSKLSGNLTLHNINQRILYTKLDFPFDEIEYSLSNIPEKKYIIDEYFKKCKEETKDKEILTCEEWKKNLFEYCDIYKKLPTNSSKYNGIRVGGWFSRQYKKKNNKEDEIYKELSENTYIKKYLDKYLEKNK